MRATRVHVANPQLAGFRSRYVEVFYLPFLGPTTWAVARHLDAALEASSERSVFVDDELLARAVGVGGGKMRGACERLVDHTIVIWLDNAHLALPVGLPILGEKHIKRMPPHLQYLHPRVVLELEQRQNA